MRVSPELRDYLVSKSKPGELMENTIRRLIGLPAIVQRVKFPEVKRLKVNEWTIIPWERDASGQKNLSSLAQLIYYMHTKTEKRFVTVVVPGGIEVRRRT